MQVTPIDGAAERRTLIAAIVSTEFLGRVVSKLGKDPFRSQAGNLIYGFCKDWYGKYHQAPKREIESLFEEWAKRSSDKDAFSTIQRLLSSLSREHDKEIVLEYSLDLAQKYFNEVMLERLQEEIRSRLEKGQVEAALAAKESFKRVDLARSPIISVLDDEEAQKNALLSKQRVLVKYPGAAGEFFGEELSEDSFVGIMAGAKGAKSFTLLDIAWRAMMQGRKVAYFQVGDLSFNQVMMRFLIRAAYRPARACTLFWPTSIILPPGGSKELAMVDKIDKTYEEPISWPQARKAFKRAKEKYKGDIKLSYHPIKTITVAGIRDRLDELEVQGYRADVVVIDYAGNLAAEDVRMASHEQTAYSWAMMRQISDVRKCLVVTANQANKEGFSSWVLTRKHFSDSKMILAHVTSFLGVNMTDEEKGKGIIRYNFVVRRESQYRESYCLYCASALGVANTCVLSCLPSENT